MASLIIQNAIILLARMVVGRVNFDQILMLVKAWEEKQITGAQKRQGVLSELTILGVQIAEGTARTGIQLAVEYIKRKAA